jgi:asparagine synthetase B (glutamine-hydrolysing)
MLNSLLKIRNWCWAEDRSCRELGDEDIFAIEGSIQRLAGQFAFAAVNRRNGRIRLVRDRLGINKLFFAIHNAGEVAVANYLVDLVASGAPMKVIFSVPAGHMLDIDLQTRQLMLKQYFDVRLAASNDAGSLEASAAAIRRDLETWFARLAKQWQSRRVCVCVSGGLDSGLIAALAARYLSKATFYTYGFVDGKQHGAADAAYAQQLAAFLGCPLRYVPTEAEDVLDAVERALLYGQDWRDFNVHCAIVNDLLARAIRRDWIESGDAAPPVVLTGDLMNEFLADYTAIHYRGREYYRLPRLNPDSLRAVLIKGLDAGDREVGVFGHYGIDLVQPYGLLAHRLMGLPSPLVVGSNAKQRLMKAIAEDLLPAWIFERPKVRAQIGSADEPIGILPVLHDAGYDAKWLKDRFCQLFGIENASFLNLFIRSGQYRYAADFPAGG